MMRPEPCLPCLKRGEAFRAPRDRRRSGSHADGQVWLAVALGYEARIIGLVRARLDNDPAQAKEHLDAALKAHPDNAYAAGGAGRLECRNGAGGRRFPGEQTLWRQPRARAWRCSTAPCGWRRDNVAVRYQIALSLAGLDAEAYRGRIESELDAAIQAPPETAYEKFVQTRAGELLALLKRGDRDAFDAKLRPVPRLSIIFALICLSRPSGQRRSARCRYLNPPLMASPCGEEISDHASTNARAPWLRLSPRWAKPMTGD